MDHADVCAKSTALFVLLLVAGCTRTSGATDTGAKESPALANAAGTRLTANPAASEVSQPDAGSATLRVEPLPKRSSAFDGWKGLKVVRGGRCKNCCGLGFPPDFGFRNRVELGYIKGIIEYQAFEHDLDCGMMFGDDAADQLRRLASERQDPDAARMVVGASTLGGLDLGGGEFAEVYPVEVLLPVVLGYKRLPELLTPELQAHVATLLCGAAFSPTTSEDVDIEFAIRQMRAQHFDALADSIVQRCAEFERENQ